MSVNTNVSRQRATLACNTCRSRRTKCDGRRPTCLFCDEHGIDCTYRNPSLPAASRYESSQLIECPQTGIFIGRRQKSLPLENVWIIFMDCSLCAPRNLDFPEIPQSFKQHSCPSILGMNPSKVAIGEESSHL